VIVRLERDVHRRAGHVVTGVACRAQRLGFRVRLALAVMPALAEGPAVAYDHRTDGRIGRRVGDRARRQFDGAREIGAVGPVYG
jgi:hypothetical protein